MALVALLSEKRVFSLVACLLSLTYHGNVMILLNIALTQKHNLTLMLYSVKQFRNTTTSILVFDIIILKKKRDT